jgi:MYXO-CTERM domain-containing protein
MRQSVRFLGALAVALTLPWVSLADISITSPTPSTVWAEGGTYTVEWTDAGDEPTVTIRYFPPGVTWAVPLAEDIASTGSAEVTIPDEYSYWGAPAGIAVRGPVSEDRVDFELAGYDLTSPSGGWVMNPGPREATWDSYNVTGNVDLEFSSDGETWVPLALDTPDDGACEIVIPRAPSDACAVRISPAGDELIPRDIHDNIWIRAFQVTHPNGGEVFVPGETVSVTWTSNHMGPNVDILISSDGGLWWDTVAEGVPDDGEHEIVLGDEVGREWLVRVMDSENEPWQEFYDESDAVFTVDDSFEDNDAHDVAVAVGTGQYDRLVAVDEDWYLVETETTGAVEAIAVHGGDEPEMELYLEDGTTMVASGTAFRLLEVPAGTYLLRVAPGAGPCDYSLTLSVDGEDLLLDAEGPDWTLPPGYEREPTSGFFSFGTGVKSSRIPVASCGDRTCSWATLNPEEGVYDFDILWDRIDDLEGTPYVFGLRISSVVDENVPGWVVAKHSPATFTSARHGLTMINPMDPGVEEDFLIFMEALAAQDLGSHPKVVFAYIHGFSTSPGEEMWLDWDDFPLAVSSWGMTSGMYHDWAIRRVDAWADAFSGNEDKLIWVGTPTSLQQGAGDEWNLASIDVCNHVLDVGGAFRGGIIELYNYRLDTLTTGQSFELDPYGRDGPIHDAYLVTDLDYPPIAENRATGDENEEYDGRKWPVEENPHRWHESTLRCLSMHFRFVYITRDAYAIDPDLSAYAQGTWGKRVHDSIDAWSYLREAYIRHLMDDPELTGWRDIAMKNFERYLYQRDMPGAMTVAVEPVERSEGSGSEAYLENPPWGTDPAYDLTARRTDRDSGSDRIVFDVEDRFLEDGTDTFLLKVTWLDDGAPWHALFDGGGPVSTQSVTGTGSGEWRTATLLVDGAAFAGGLEGERDLAVVSETDDVTVKLVRLVKLPTPAQSLFDPGGIDPENPEDPDESGGPDGPSGKGCGCSTTPGRTPLTGLVILLGLLGLVLARRW